MGLIRVIAGFQKKAPPHPLPPAHPDCSLSIAYVAMLRAEACVLFAVTGDGGEVPLGLYCRVAVTLSCTSVVHGGTGQRTGSWPAFLVLACFQLLSYAQPGEHLVICVPLTSQEPS